MAGNEFGVGISVLFVLLLAQAGQAAPTVTLGQIEAVAGGAGVAAWMDTGAVSPSSIPQATSKVKYNFVINAGGESYGTADAIVVDVLEGSTSTTDAWTLDCPSIIENQKSGSEVLTAIFSTTAACSFTVTVGTTHQANGAMPAYKVAVTFKKPANHPDPGQVISSTQFAALKVYTGNTLTVAAPTITSADDVPEKYVEVSTDKVPRRTAKYTYGITLQNGKKAMSAAAAYLKLSTSLPSSAPAGTVTPTIAAYTCGIIDASKKLTATLSADNGYPCSMDVLLTSYDTTGAVPEFKVTASWVHTSASGTTLFDEALLIPTLTVSHSAPVYTGSTLSVAVPVINADDALDAAKHVAVDGTKVPKADARYTYEVTLTNGKLPIQSSANVYLKLTTEQPSTAITGNTIPPISSYTCKQGSNFADTLDGNKLKSNLAADAQIKCTFNVPLTGLDVRGTAPIFRVQASWLATSLSGSLYNKALLIPTSADTQTAPVYTGSTLTVGAPSLNSSDADDSTQYVLAGVSKVPKSTAEYSYVVTLNSGKMIIPATTDVFLKLTLAMPADAPQGTTAPAIAAYSCDSNIHVDTKKLTVDLPANTVVTCTVDVRLTNCDATGTVPAFTVTASWVTGSAAGTNLLTKALFIPTSAATTTAPVYTGNTLIMDTPAVITTDTSKYIDVDGTPLVMVHGLVRYPVSVKIGAMNIPQSATLSFTNPANIVTFVVSKCTANTTGVSIDHTAAIPTSFLSAGQVIKCDLVVNVTTAQKDARQIAPFEVQAAFAGSGITAGAKADALYVPTKLTSAVEVFGGTPMWKLSSKVTSTDKALSEPYDNKLLPLLGAEVTYTVVFINADTAYPRMTIGVTTTLPSADDSYPTSVTSCKTGATSITLPVASLAANTALVCTFKVRVRADHVAFKKLPKITLQATNGSTTISTISTSPPNNELPGLSVYTRPSLAIYNYLDDGTVAGATVSPIKIESPFEPIAVQGSKIVYAVTFKNGYAPVAATTKFILAITGTAFLYTDPQCQTTTMAQAGQSAITVTAAGALFTNGIPGEDDVQCTFDYIIKQADKERGKTPDITVKVQLLSHGASQAQDVATATYSGIPVLSTQVARVMMDTLADATTVDGVAVPHPGAIIPFKLAFINAGGTDVTADGTNKLDFVITRADTTMPASYNATTCVKGADISTATAATMPLATNLASRHALVCEYQVPVTDAYAAVDVARVPGFKVSVTKTGVNIPGATWDVPETRIYTQPALAYTLSIQGSSETVNNTIMAREMGTVTYTFSLYNGARGIPSTTEVTLSSNSSVFKSFISCTTSSNTEPFNLGDLKGLPAYNRLKCNLERQVTAADVALGTFPAFTVKALTRDTTKYTPTYEQYAAVNIPAMELFTGVPCQKCRACIGQMFDFAQPLLAETDAQLIGTKFNTLCRASRQTWLCQNVTRMILESTNGNVGKRAGKLCTELGECEPVRFERDCSLASINPLLSTSVPNGKVDQCKPQGTSAGTVIIPGVEATLNYTAGTCFNDTAGSTGCPATQQCDIRPEVAKHVCVCSNTTGTDECKLRYPCIDTPCTKCSSCMSKMREFTTLQSTRTTTIPQQVADAFAAHCSSAKYDATLCSIVAKQIADSFEGNLGKRPGWLCQQLKGCPTNMTTLPATCVIVTSASSTAPNVTNANFDLCTMDGWSTGAKVQSPSMYPNTSVPWPAGTCNGTTGPGSCNATLGQLCSYAANKQFCTCDPATGRDVCRPMGDCVTVGCRECNTCISRTIPWITSRINVTDAAILANDWSTHCASIPGSAGVLCDTIKTAILASYNGNLAKRAGNLCSRLNLCSTSATCGLNVTSTNTSAAPFAPLATLDLCTMEGVARANSVPGVLGQGFSLSSRIPLGHCHIQDDNTPSTCPSNHRCDVTAVKGALCKCETADLQGATLPVVSDTCLKYYGCVRTPCKICSDCLGDMAAFAQTNLYESNHTILGAAFGEYCTQKGYGTDVCKKVSDEISSKVRTVASAKRAGSLCVALGMCDPTGFDLSCMLTFNGTLSVNASTFDQCKVQGVAGGNDVPGSLTVTTGQPPLPTGRCDNDADCTTGLRCNKAPEVLAPVCTCYKGQETCRSLGVCVKKPCPGCSECLNEFASWTNLDTTQQSTPNDLVGLFQARCNRSAVVCQAARTAIINSYNSNAGRRAGSICRLLGECNATAMAAEGVCNHTVTTVSPAPSASPFSLCTRQGVELGTAVQNYPINITYTLGAGKCISNADCNTASGFECKMPLPGQPVDQVCFCNPATGRDVCTPTGTCTATACQVCQTCLDVVNPVIRTELSKNDSAPSITAACNAAQTKLSGIAAPADCPSITPRYLTAVEGKSTGYFGLRAAALCSALGRCVNVPTTCQLRAEVARTNITGALDLCTAEGIVGGSAVFQGIPKGACLQDADCGADMQCNRANTTNKVNKCVGGIDLVTDYGACVAKPPPKTEVPPCTRCGDCINAVRASVEAAALNSSAQAAALGDAFYAACSKAQYALAACRNVSVMIAASPSGNLARRAGALCARLGECSAALSTDASCAITTNSTAAATQVLALASSSASSGNSTNTTTATNPPAVSGGTAISGRFDTCTIEGVSAGGMLLGTYKQDQDVNNTCVLDSDCSAGMTCSSARTFRVCRCMNGIDSCDTLNTCQAPPTPKPTLQMTPCQKCEECLNNTLSFVNAIDALGNAADPKEASATFMTRCTMNLTSNNVLACKPVADAIFYDIRLARRSGAICQRLGMCAPELAAGSACNMTVGTKSGRLNLCLKEGVGASTAAATVTFNNTHCRTDADCRNGTQFLGTVCSFDTTLSAKIKQVESCNNGVDTVVQTGSCIGFCETQQAYLKQVNDKVNQLKCTDPFFNCGAGMTCKASPLCRTLECANSTVGIVTVPCYGFCMASERAILSAKMLVDGKTITAALNTAAAPGTFPCAVLFNGPTMDKLGYDAQCSVDITQGKELQIKLGPQSTFMPEVDTLTVLATQIALVDFINTKERFTGTSIPVSKCATDCTKPTAVLFGPSFVSVPCDDKAASDVIFDASFSSDVSGRPLSKVYWELTAGGPDVVLSAAIDKANLANSGNGAYRLVIPGSQIANMPGTNAYTVKVTIRNFLGAVDDKSLTFSKKSSGVAPALALPLGASVSYKITEGVKVPVALAAASVCANQQVVYSWQPVGAWGAIPAGYSKKDLIIPGPVPGVDAGSSKTVVLTAKFDKSTESTNVTVTLVAEASLLQAKLRGPWGDTRNDRDIVLSAAASRDPDDPLGLRPLAVTWECTRADFPTPCFTGANSDGIQDGLTWTIPALTLADGVEHTIKATVYRTHANASIITGAGNSATAVISFTPRSAVIPTGRIRRMCGPAQCPLSHSADSSLIVTLVPDAGSESATVTWSSEQVPTAGAVTGKDWIIPASQLPKSGSITVKAVLSSSSSTSTTSLTIPINGKPTCTKDTGCIAVDATTGVFPNARFTAEAVGFVDDQKGLRFDFGVLGSYDARVVIASGPSPTYTFTGLPVGDAWLYVCAVDTDGARACSQTKVTVTAPSTTDFKVADALAAFDVRQLVGTGDVSVLASGAQALQSLSEFANKPDVAATKSDAEKEQVQKAIAAKTSSMINTLAVSASDYINDPETMQQVVSAVATLTKASTQLSKDTKDKMLGVADSGIAAAKLKKKALSPAEASRLWAVVAAGNDLQASCKVPGSCAKAAKVARRLLEELPDWLDVNTIYSRSLLESAAAVSPVYAHRNLQQANQTASPSPSTNSTSPAPSPSPAPVVVATTPAPVVAADAFTPPHAAQAKNIGDLLAQGAGPASYLSGGDNGLYLSVANFIGRNYEQWNVVSGPVLDATGNQATAANGENAQLKFSKPLVGSCVDEDGNAIGKAATCADVVVPVRFTYLPDAAPLISTAAASAVPASRKLQAVGERTIVSGAATVEVAGDSKSALPCDSCTATVSIPTWEQKEEWMLYDCGKIVNGVVTWDVGATSSGVQQVGTPAVPTVTCTVSSAGSYIIGKRVDPNRPAGTPEVVKPPAAVTGDAPVPGQPLKYSFRLEINETLFGSVDDFLKDSTRVKAFSEAVKSEIHTSFTAKGFVGISKEDIQVLNIEKGSIKFDVLLDTKAITDSNALNAIATYMRGITEPEELFSSEFITTYGVTGMTVTPVKVDTPAASTNLAAIIGGVVGGAGGVIIIAVVAFFIIRRRRMTAVEPRGTGNRSLLNGADHSA